jgi:DNA-binding beta-propeller fold protein YncE
MSPSRGISAALLLALALLPAAARGDGLPVPVDDAGPGGIVASDGSGRYVTVPARGGTVVERIDPAGGRVIDSQFLTGRFTIPVVALDGTPDGLSHNGHELVVIKPRTRFPRNRTKLAVIDTRGLRVKRVIDLRGDFSFDALSRDGSTVFLINYIDRRNPTRYRVRTLDPATGRLAPRPIVDPDENAEEMRGYPLDRITSPDGRWHYTLYDGAGGHPFVHALNTEEVQAKCIDLPAFPARLDPSTVRLRLAGHTLGVGRLASVDTRTFAVTQEQRLGKAAGKPEADEGSSAAPWIAGIGALLAATGIGIALRARAKSRSATPA